MAASPPLSVHAWLRYATIDRLLKPLTPRTVLEIGFGMGSIGVLLARRYDYAGIEHDEAAITAARARFVRYGVDANRLHYGGLEQVGGRQFDLVCAFEVLEHFEDDVGTLEGWRPFVTAGGAIMVSVPAGSGRFGAADEKAGHFRRYSRHTIERTLESAGFEEIRILNYGYPVGYILEMGRNVLARRQLRRPRTQWERTLASGRWLQPSDWMGPITHAAAAPAELIQRPFMGSDHGTGLVAMGVRRS